MNCEEVIELMQRELDGDLSQVEQKKLFQHLPLCQDCQTLFGNLSALSLQLEALPKVQPKYSIVDSILPMLDHIDQANDNKPKKNLSKKNEVQKKKGSGYKQFWVPGGIVAAALFLIVYSGNSAFLNKSSQEKSMSESDMFTTHQVGEQVQDSASNNMLVTEQNGQDIFTNENAMSVAGDEDLNRSANNQVENENPGSDENVAVSSSNSEEGNQNKETSKNPESKESVQKSEEVQPSDQEVEQPPESVEPSESPYSITTIEERPSFYSPDGSFIASFGIRDEYINIDTNAREPYYTTQQFDKPWKVESMEWVSNADLYYIVYNPDKDERSYWILNVKEKKEVQLEEPFPKKVGVNDGYTNTEKVN
jgi:hypothetical protein